MNHKHDFNWCWHKKKWNGEVIHVDECMCGCSRIIFPGDNLYLDKKQTVKVLTTGALK